MVRKYVPLFEDYMDNLLSWAKIEEFIKAGFSYSNVTYHVEPSGRMSYEFNILIEYDEIGQSLVIGGIARAKDVHAPVQVALFKQLDIVEFDPEEDDDVPQPMTIYDFPDSYNPEDYVVLFNLIDSVVDEDMWEGRELARDLYQTLSQKYDKKIAKTLLRILTNPNMFN